VEGHSGARKGPYSIVKEGGGRGGEKKNLDEVVVVGVSRRKLESECRSGTKCGGISALGIERKKDRSTIETRTRAREGKGKGNGKKSIQVLSACIISKPEVRGGAAGERKKGLTLRETLKRGKNSRSSQQQRDENFLFESMG